jgi:hypothetical protein
MESKELESKLISWETRVCERFAELKIIKKNENLIFKIETNSEKYLDFYFYFVLKSFVKKKSFSFKIRLVD